MDLVMFAVDELGIPKAQIARMLGVNEVTFWRWSKGRRKVHPCAVRIMGMLLEVPGAFTWLNNTTEILLGKPEVQKRAVLPDDSNDVDRTAPWNQ